MKNDLGIDTVYQHLTLFTPHHSTNKPCKGHTCNSTWGYILEHHDVRRYKVKCLDLVTPRQVLVIAIITIVAVIAVITVRLGGWLGGRLGGRRGGRLRNRGVRLRNRGGGRLGDQSGVGRNGERLAANGRRNDDLASNAKNLANVDVAALGIDLRVVLVKESGVHAVSSSDSIASIIPGHDCEAE